MADFGFFVREQMTIEIARIPVVVLSAIAVYVTFLFFVHIFGARVFSRMSATDAVLLVMYGAVAGRVVVGHPPTLAAGLIGLFTLMIMEAIFGAVSKSTGLRHALDGRPRVVLAHGKVVEKQLRKARLNRNDIRYAVRKAGVARLEDVQCMILEPNGEITLIRAGVPIEPELLKGVVGVDAIYR